MLIISLLLIPLLGVLIIITGNNTIKSHTAKIIGLAISVLNLVISLFIFIVFDYSNIEYQFVQEVHEFNGLNIYLGIDGISIYFVLLTSILTPLVLLSNWHSISHNIKSYVIIILLLETLLLAVFLVF